MPDAEDRHLKFVYRTTFGVALVGFHIAGLVAIDGINQLVFGGGRKLEGAGAALSALSLVAAHVTARQWCRWLGISRDTHEVLVLERGTATPAPDTPAEADLHYPPKLWATLALALSVCLGIVVAVLVLGGSKPGTETCAYLLIAMLGSAELICLRLYLIGGGFVGRADERGVSGHHGNRVLVRYVEWERIGTCEVTAVRNALGASSQPLFVFKDRDGVVLLRMVTPVEAEQTQRFRAVIERYLATVELVSPTRERGTAAGGGKVHGE